MAWEEPGMTVEEMRREVALTHEDTTHPTMEEVEAAGERFEAEKVYGWHKPSQEKMIKEEFFALQEERNQILIARILRGPEACSEVRVVSATKQYVWPKSEVCLDV